MKIRKGFVSNSSSSSFICDVCGETAGGMDMYLEDVAMIECVCGHIMCENHAKNLLEHFDLCDEKDKEKERKAKEEGREWSKVYSGGRRYDVPSKHCPFCCLENLSTGDELLYYHMRFGMTNEEVLEDIIEIYGDYVSFLNAAHETIRKRRSKNGESNE
jgi:hypothetical protein